MRTKGFAIGTETLVYIIIALIVLIFLIFIFQDQSNMFVEKIKGIFGLTDQAVTK
jgi:hypothetical protein